MTEPPHPRLSKPIHEERVVKVICIGAGLSGLALAYKLRRSFTNFELVIYEKNEGISGVWFENKYPGCTCDIPAHSYCYSFEPKTDWTSVYAPAAEIRQYFEDFAEKYELNRYIKLKHQVTEAIWNASSGEWNLSVKRAEDNSIIQDKCHILINAMGALNSWKWPNIPGIETFKGKLVHSANWDENLDLQDKTVGLIGNGASGIQILPAIYPQVRKITHFIRSATWVAPPLAGPQRFYTEEEKLGFRNNTDSHLEYRKAQHLGLHKLFPVMVHDSEEQKMAAQMMGQAMKSMLPEHLHDVLVPDYDVGCRRLTPGFPYLQALAGEKSSVVVGEIKQITEGGCVDGDGKEHAFDVLICATGFDTSFSPQFPIIGENGVKLDEAWKEEVKDYMGVGVAELPNYFVVGGPSTPISAGPAVYMFGGSIPKRVLRSKTDKNSELQVEYILKMVDRYQTENIHSFAPKREAVEDYVCYRDHFMKGSVWSQGCRSWYKSQSSGKVSGLWPGNALHFVAALSEPRFEDWEYKYQGNRFWYFGNGRSQVEKDEPEVADWAFYLRKEDNSDYLSRRLRLAALTAKKA
ncbi:hypothetical protein CVT24_011861 [Panaeolus cyanescens]|uniref:FAD/NAD(P)-binding domain-containing protein n=1 Tax=Panaeolus cyanescens TaxID=181874 RepID=A0A409YNI6_9AGAR|nr:hypothetical protein CVT24_011861 [Panaeolus cyanescens]